MRDMTKDKSARQEWTLYAIIWLVAAVLPLVLELREYFDSSIFEWRRVFRWWTGMMPLLMIFLIHYFLLFPELLKKGKMLYYILSVMALLCVYGGIVVTEDKHFHDDREPVSMHHGHHVDARPDFQEKVGPERPHHHPPHRFPLPIILKLLFAMLMLGLNVAISLAVDHLREQADRRELENYRLQEELKYLRQQISPHFFMNVLNNIHEMAEEDVAKAQDMILELSNLMRYVLYESGNDRTTLSAECKFISSYVGLMSRRYLEDTVRITLDLPESINNDVHVPPLLFISFIENAFKHGVSYLNDTYINISLTEWDGHVIFSCDNSIPQKRNISEGGLGLANVRRRLDLLYGDSYSLNISEDERHYNVTLTIPTI